MKKTNLAAPCRWDYAAAALLLTACGLLFAHPDILETANHTWLFLDHVFSGDLLDFYTDTLAHNNDFWYVNAAHYNIFLYAVFGLWMLPVYGIAQLTGAVPAAIFLTLWAKALACLAAVGCGVLTVHIAQKTQGGGTVKPVARWAGLGFLLSPITVFACFTMGQYDSICLFFLLLALCYYLDGRMWRFAFVMGFAVVCKMFALLVFLPLLVLREKKLHRIAALAALALWLYIPTGLLFSGRDGDMHVFNDIMLQRLFDAQLPGGAAGLPLFLTALAVICVICWLYRPDSQAALAGATVHTGFCVLGLLFLFVVWHPQWLILLVPFLLLGSLQLRQRHFWVWLDLLFYAGFFLLCCQQFPRQLEGNLLDGGLWGALSGTTALSGAQNLSFYYGLLPYVLQLSPVLFGAPLLCGMLFKCPWRGGCLADMLAGKVPEPAFDTAPALARGPAWLTRARCAVWLTFAIGYCGCWLAPCVFQWLQGWIL